MKLLCPTLCAAAATAGCFASSNIYADSGSFSAGTIEITTDSDTSDLTGAPDLTAAQKRRQAELTEAFAAKPVSKPYKLLDNTNMSYRLDILGDLFTPGEQAFLSTSSKVFGSAREMVKDSSASRIEVSERGSRGSAYSRGISTAFLTAADSTGNGWAPLTSWSVPYGSLRGAMGNQIAPMVWDLSEKSRGSNFGSVSLIEKAVVLLPSGRSLTSQLEIAEFKVGLQSLVSGKWPTFAHLEQIDYPRFCKIWLGRIANVAMANCIATLLTPKNAGRPGVPAAAKLRGPPPVTVNYRF